MHLLTKFIFLAIAVSVFTGCAPRRELELFHTLDSNRSFGEHRTVATTHIHSVRKTYYFRPYDTIAMTIYGQPESSTRPEGVLISGSGYATLPIVGRVRVAGLSEASASRKIQRLVRKYDTEAIVVVENPNKIIYVIGDVKKAGIIKLTSGQIPLLRAIGSAGGFRDDANRDVLYLVRKKGSTAKLIRLSLSNNGSLRDAFFALIPGDIVYVAPNSAKMADLGPGHTLKIIASALSPFGAARSLAR